MTLEQICDDLMEALEHGTVLPPVSERIAAFGPAMGYELGADLASRRMGRGEHVVGRKLGFTNRALWEQLGVDAPFWAVVYDTTTSFAAGGSGAVSLDGLAQPRLEPELVVHVAKAPPAKAGEAEVLTCIDWVAPAIEIVQCHFPAWEVSLADAIADFGVHGALVVGTPTEIRAIEEPVRSLAEFTIVLSRDGKAVAIGSGDRVLGSPLRALAYVLQQVESQAGWQPLQPGDIVTTGTLTGLHSVEPGETWEIVSAAGLPLEPLRVRIY